MFFKYFSRQILFSRTFQDMPVYSSTSQACANPGDVTGSTSFAMPNYSSVSYKMSCARLSSLGPKNTGIQMFLKPSKGDLMIISKK